MMDILTKTDDNSDKYKPIDTQWLSTDPEFQQKLDNFGDVNAVLPLFDPSKDASMGEILETRLFNLLMNFNVTLNIDQIDQTPYISLLTHAYLFCYDNILKKTRVEEMTKLSNYVLDTLELLSKMNGKFAKILNSFEKNLNEVMTYKEYKATKDVNGYEDLSLVLTVIMLLKKKKNYDSDELEEMMHKFWVEYFWNRSKNTGLDKLVLFSFEEANVEQFMSLMEKDNEVLKRFWTTNDISRNCAKVYKEVSAKITMDNTDSSLKLNQNGIRGDTENKVTYEIMKACHLEVVNNEVNESELIAFIRLAFEHKSDNSVRANSAISFDQDSNSKYLAEKQ
jgi:hypothetical protein